MAPKFLTSWLPRTRKHTRRHSRSDRTRLGVEYLEERLAPAGLPPDIVVGRTLSAYTVAGVQNNTLNVTYTVYNEQSGDVTGVLLTTTLQPGVTFASASALPDRSGQELAWSLGTLPAFGRSSVTLTVTLPDAATLQIDSGARGFGTLNAGMVTDDTPAAALVNRVIPADQLASTPDANTTDPFVQEQAAKLDYDPQRIFDYLNTDVGYESYTGSLRGARGTLWSAAGNSLDEASLGVALFRASGIPARYAQGTLSDPLSKQLILSMFPASYQTVGYIPAGTPVADPANDPKLLAETRNHYWVQFDATGAGFVNADSSNLPGGGIGTAFTTTTETFTEVADALRHKVRVKLDAETYSQIGALFGLGNGLSTATVLDRTFNSVDLVGRPLTIGNFVSQSAIGALIFSSRTTTYSPYIVVGDEALPGDQLPEALRGTDFQEVMTNFPLGNQLLTGLFLNMTLTGPDGSAESYDRALVDRIGFAARQGFVQTNVSVDPNGPPPLSPFDSWTVSVLPGLQNPRATPRIERELRSNLDTVRAQVAANDNTALPLALTDVLVGLSQSYLTAMLATSDLYTGALASESLVKAYFDRPRITLVSAKPTAPDPQTLLLTVEADLRRDTIRGVVFPGQALSVLAPFRTARGIVQNIVETNVFPRPATASGLNVPVAVSTTSVIQAAAAQGIPLVTLTPEAPARVDALSISPEAKARITSALVAGRAVIVPAQAVTIDGSPRIAWYEVDRQTGETIGVGENGAHQGITEFGATLGIIAAIGVGGAFTLLSGLGVAFANIDFNAIRPNYDAYLATFGDKQLALQFFEKDVEALKITEGAAFPMSLFDAAYNTTLQIQLALFKANVDPPVPLSLSAVAQPLFGSHPVSQTVTVPANIAAGPVAGTVQAPRVSASGQLTGSWSGAGVSGFRVQSLGAAGAVVTNGSGATVGSGAVSLAPTGPLAAAVAGNNQYSVTGSGSLTFYGPAAASLGVSGNWDNYSASVTGNVSITLTTDALILNGTRLPAGTYTITASAATLGGSGPSTSPAFSGSASVSVTNGTVALGRGTGGLTIGGNPLDPTNGVALTGYTGTLTVAAVAGDLDSVTLTGTAADVMTTSANLTTVTADQNTPATFPVNLRTSFADTYTLTAQTPPGWTVTVNTAGVVTVTPAPGLQTGSYPVRVIARSKTNPDLVAQTTVNVTVTATLPGITLAVTPDALLTVPFNGAQVPSAFQATLRNLGPAADTFTLTFPNPPAGFTILNSGPAVTVPAGETGILGIYLQPSGSQLPAPGTVITFTVTATSTTNPAITDTKTVTFTMPEVHGVTFTAAPSAVATTPGSPTTTTLTLTAVGNVADSIALTATLPSGLSATGLPTGPISLNPGQSTTITIGLTPAAATPLNSTLAATFTATFGPAASPLTQTLQVPVRVVVPGADAIAGASFAATQLGNADLADRLSDLATAMTNLFQTPDSPVFKGQTLAALDAVGRLIAADPFLTGIIGPPDSARQALAGATTPAQVRDGITQIGDYLSSLNGTLTDIAEHGFMFTLDTNTVTLLPGAPARFPVSIRNTGSLPTTYSLTVGSVPAGLTGRFVRNGNTITSVTLQPGEALVGGPNAITLEFTATGNELFATAVSATAVPDLATELVRQVEGSLTVRREFVQVSSVGTNPPFTNAGGQVAVSARLLNAVNRQQTASVSFVVKDPAGAVIFTSNPTAVTLTVQTSLQTVNLGNFDTTGLANGDYAIEVTVRDGSNAVLPGGTGNGRLQIGLPVTATLTAGPPTLATGNGTVSNTLSLTTNTTLTPPFSLVGQVATTLTSSTIVIRGTTAYVAGSNGVDIVDVSNPAAPVKRSTFAQDLIVRGGYTVVRELPGDRLVVASTISLNASGTTVLVYSVTDPLNPVLLFNKQIQEAFMSDFLVSGSTALLTTQGVFLFGNNSAGSAFDQFGDVTALNLDAAGGPAIADRLFGTRNPPFTGDTFQTGGEIVNPTTAYITSTTLSGNNFTNGVGRLLVVNYADPANLVLTREVQVPGTVSLSEVAADGNTALVVGSTRGGLGSWNNNDADPANDSGNIGNLTLTTLDITDRDNPVVVSTVVTAAVFPRGDQPSSKLAVVPVGGGRFAISLGIVGGNPVIFLVDASNPQTILTSALRVNAVVSEMVVNGGKLYTTSADGLLIYDIGQVDTVPVTASVTIPKNTGVAVVANSFNIPPTQIVAGPNFDTLVFDRRLAFGLAAETITWQTAVTDLKPGELRAVTGGTTVNFSTAANGDRFVVPGTSNPWLAGMPDGSTASGDTAPAQSPPAADGLTLTPGDALVFLAAGQVANASFGGSAGPDGGFGLGAPADGFTPHAAENGIAAATVPLNGLVGIFLGPDQPDLTAAPAGLDFRPTGNVPGGVNYTTLAPLLKQVFFIGDGLTAGGIPQRIVVPAGATRLFLGTMDGYSWSNNVGSFQVSVGEVTGSFGLPATTVTAAPIIGLAPPTRTAQPGGTAAYTVTLSNPTTVPVTYSLSVQGVPADWVDLPPTATVAAGGSVNVPLQLTPAVFAAVADYGFVVTAVDSANAAGARGSAEASLTVAGTPTPVDSQSHGVVVQLTPASATAGQGTSATYTVRVTNTGSATEEFDLFPPFVAGIQAFFAQDSVAVPPGAGNYREVQLTLTPVVGLAVADYPFVVTAQSLTSAARNTANGTLTLVASGVSVALDRASGSPGDTFMATVTNTGTATDTFDLSAAGPGGLVATLGSAKLTLAPGESRAVPVATAAAGFAVQGKLNLLVAAQSETDAAVRDSASAGLQVAPSVGLSAGLTPPTQTLPAPGATAFTVLVNNTGNTEDAYTATITGTTGPITASLVGLDGLPTQTIPTFRIPGLSTGALLLNATAAGPGTVTVTITSLNDPSRTATVTATVGIAAPVSPPVSPPPVSPPTATPTPTARKGRGQLYAIGAGPGGGPRVQVYDAATNEKKFDFFAFDSALRGGVSVATGDVTGDGIQDIIAGAGDGGGANVKVFDGATGSLLASWYAYDPQWRGGVWVAAGDLDGDGTAEIVTGPGPGGGPVVKVWRFAGGTPTMTDSLLAFEESFRGGSTVAVGLGPDGRAVLAVGAGPGGGPRVRTFDALTHAILSDQYAFDPTFAGGVYLASGDVLGTGAGTQILVGPGLGGGPRLRVLGTDGAELANTFAAVATLRNGLTVAALDRVGKPAAVLVGAGAGAYRGDVVDGALGGVDRVGFFGDGFDGGVFVG